MRLSAQPEGRLPVLIGADPLAGRRTGIGQYTLQLVRGLALHPDVRAFACVRGDLREVPGEGPAADAALAAPSPWPLQDTRARILSAHAALQVLRDRFDAVRFQLATAALRGRALYHEPNFVTRPFDGPCAATLHDLTWLHYPDFVDRVTLRWLERGVPRTLRQAQRIFAVSHFVAEELTRHLGIPPERITVTPLGVDVRFHPRPPEAIAGDLAPLGLEPGGYLLSVATLEPRKNLAGLLRAYAELPVRLQRRHPIVLAGARGWHGHEIEPLVARLELRGALKLLGYVDERVLPAVYAGARAFAFPTFYEGFGLPPLEAMASAVPVLTSERAATAEVCADAALLVDPRDQQAIRDGLERLLTEEPLRQRLRERGAARARELSWERTVEGTLAGYRLLLGG